MARLEVNDGEAYLRRILLENRFDFDQPNPEIAWSVFKEFARVPVRSAGERLYFQLGIVNPWINDPFTLDMARYFDVQDEAADFHHTEHVHILLKCRPTNELKDLKAHLWSQNFPNLSSFEFAVESCPEFSAALAHSSWTCSVYKATCGYKIISEISNRGDIAIYKALDLQHDRQVALKVCRSPDATARSRLTRAAQCLAHLQQFTADIQQTTVVVYEIGWPSDELFVAMELVEGGRLADRIGTPWPSRQAAEFIQTLAETVHAIQRQGMIHREIHPWHILLATDGRPKLIGFRYALNVAFLGAAKPTGEIIGLPSYMSPEQARGELPTSSATDIYSVGAVFYELLTGRPPFRELTVPQTLHAVITNEPITPRQFRPNVPERLETICLKCIAKRPEDRYQTADALVADLRQFLSAEFKSSALLRGWNWLLGKLGGAARETPDGHG